MKKTIIIITILITLNLLALPTLLNIKNNDHKLNQVLEQIPDNTVYVSTSNSIYNEMTVSQMEDLFRDLDGFKNFEKIELQESDTIPYSGMVHNKNNTDFKDTVSIPLINLANPQDQQFEIISGRNLTDDSDTDIVISSSFANHISTDIDSLVNTYIGNYKIVGIYNDPIQYSQNNRYATPLYSFSSKQVDLQTTNVAYISSSTFLDDEFSGTYEMVNGVENLVHNYMFKLTFNNDEISTNIDAIESIVGDQGIILSNQGVSDTDYYTGFYTSAKLDNTTLRICLLLIDTLVLILLITLNRKGSNA